MAQAHKPTRIIRFTYALTKLQRINTGMPVTLLHASKTRLSKLSGSFLRYDTRFATRSGYFNLDGLDEIILLLFEDIEGTLFSTLRSYNEAKFLYYSSNIGQQFTVELKEDLKQSVNSRPPRLKDLLSR